MPQSREQRALDVARIKQLLNTQDGKVFVDELEDTWDQFNLMGDTPEDTAYNVGLRDAYKFIRTLQTQDIANE